MEQLASLNAKFNFYVSDFDKCQYEHTQMVQIIVLKNRSLLAVTMVRGLHVYKTFIRRQRLAEVETMTCYQGTMEETY